MITRKEQLLERLTGVHSSRRSYYVELRERVQEIQLRNLQLQILNRLARSFALDMSPDELLIKLDSALRSALAVKLLRLYYPETRAARGTRPVAALAAGMTVLPPPPSPEQLAGAIEGRGTVSLAGGGALLGLRVGEQAIGLLEVVADGDRQLTSVDIEFLEQVAAQIAVGLQNSLLYREVARARQAWEETFAAVTDVLFVLEKDHTVRLANHAAQQLLGRPDPVGHKCHLLLFDRDTPCEDCPAERAVREGSVGYQQLRVRNRTVDVFVYPLAAGAGEDGEHDSGGLDGGAVVYAKDVTELVRSTRFVALGEMAAGVAHELNGPLTAIVGDAQLLLRDARRAGDTGSALQLLRDIENCGLRARGIIQNLLAFSRREEFTFEPVALNDVARHALSRVAYQIEKDRIGVDMDLAHPSPVVMGHSPRLEQILINLLLNARDALQGGAPERHIQVRTRATPAGEAVVEVQDSGMGIAADNLNRIFTPFFTTKPVGSGTGLGLSVSLGIAAAHGGRIEVESQPGEGATFSVILPAQSSPAHGGQPEEEPK